ncbi:MAG: polysaccharide deacetylase family protein [Ignavibacteriae bacterium]|nr:polysaccharide deacetylase family protein [Ignavibacteriota bacterium]MCB9214932.1 polysaccharide deacetylase family protein [Ignavibacteria bacterium]
MHHIFTVDLEDWYCTRAVGSLLHRSDWKSCESRVRIGTRRILELLERKGIEGTFFVLGYIAEREPELIREIVDRGHEIATHGYAHRSLEEMFPEEFRDDLVHSIDLITSITGKNVCGFRAPNFSLTEKTAPWAIEIIQDCDLLYDSSVFPTTIHPAHHFSEESPIIHQFANGLIEAPVSCVDLCGLRLPATGGAYFRHAPFWLSAALIDWCERQGIPALFYIHPWELDTEQPRLRLPILQRIRQYRGIESLYEKLDRLTDRFQFTSLRHLFSSLDRNGTCSVRQG